MMFAAASAIARRSPSVAISSCRSCRGHYRLAAPIDATGARFFSSSDLPYHIVVGMPALSPTMEAGSIAAWNVAEGDSFIAGDALAEIETDKATMAYEAQDDGIVARIFAEAGGDEVKVGVPIMVTVEEEEDVSAFKDFVPEAAAEEEVPPPAVEEVAAAPAPRRRNPRSLLRRPLRHRFLSSKLRRPPLLWPSRFQWRLHRQL